MKVKKEEVIELRNKGMTYEQIAKKTGISKQRVCQIVGKYQPSRFMIVSEKECIYPGIRKWRNDNKITMNYLCELMYGNRIPDNCTMIRNRCNGSVEFRKRDIDKLIEITGMTYEELFGLKSQSRGEESALKSCRPENCTILRQLRNEIEV